MKKLKQPNSLFLQGKSGKLGKLKRKLLKIFKYYTISRVAPCERAHPQLSENGGGEDLVIDPQSWFDYQKKIHGKEV